MHCQRILHLDVKPQNVLLETIKDDNFMKKDYILNRQKVKLTDFGASKMDLKCQESKVASPFYSSPDQVDGKPSAACDIYSLGKLACSLLLNKSQFIDYCLRPAISPSKRNQFDERSIQADLFPLTTIQAMTSQTKPPENLESVKKELKKQIVFTLCNKSEEKIKARNLSDDDNHNFYYRVIKVHPDLRNHPREILPTSLNTIEIDTFEHEMKKSLELERNYFQLTVDDLDQFMTKPINQTVKSNLDVIFACVTNLRGALVRFFRQVGIDVSQLLEQDSQFNFMTMVMAVCFYIAPRSICGLDKASFVLVLENDFNFGFRYFQNLTYFQNDTHDRKKIFKQSSYVANTIYKLANGTYSHDMAGWKMIPSVRVSLLCESNFV